MAIIIKRYQNRKLYNTKSKRYITLQEIIELIKEHNEIIVIDNQTGNDITTMTLSQVIYETEKSNAGYFPTNILATLIQTSGRTIDYFKENMHFTFNMFQLINKEIEVRINRLIDRGEIDRVIGSKLLDKLLYTPGYNIDGYSIETRIKDYLTTNQIPTESDLRSVMQKIESLAERISDLV